MEPKKMWVSIIIVVLFIGVVVYAGIYQTKQAGKENAPAETAVINEEQKVTSTETAPVEQQTQKPMEQTELGIKTVHEGTGAVATNGKKVTVNYTGKFADGTVFDSSLKPGRTPFEFTLGTGQVIKGWDMGVLGMKVGEKRELTIPYTLGYGETGYPPVIPAKTTLYFDVELLGVQ